MKNSRLKHLLWQVALPVAGGLWCGGRLAVSPWFRPPAVSATEPAAAAMPRFPKPPEERQSAADAGAAAGKPEIPQKLEDRLKDLRKNRRVEDLLEEINRMPAGERRHSAMFDLAREWFGLDPKATLNWIATIPEGETKTVTCRGLVEGWCKIDGHEASAWVAALPDGLFKTDMGIQLSYNLSYAFADPAAALWWAIASRDAGEEKSMINQAIDSLASLEYQTACRVIASASLNDDEAKKNRETAQAAWNQERAILGEWDQILPEPAAQEP